MALAINEKNKVFLRIVFPASTAVLLFIVAFYTLTLPRFEENLFEQKKTSIKDLTNISWSILDSYNEKYEKNILSLEAAQLQALNCIESLRYGSNKKDYFWIIDMDANMLMHPYKKEMNNTNLGNYSDPDGHLLFKEFVLIAQTKGEGYSEHMWQRYNDTAASTQKLSYVKGFEPWAWVLGTGVYLDHFKQNVVNIKREMLRASIIILIIFSLLVLYSIIKTLQIDKNRGKAENKIITLNQDLAKQLEEIKEARDQAQRSDELKDVFLQNLSHEVRTPLNAIVGFSGLLRSEIESLNSEQLEDFTATIVQNSDQLLSIVSDILTISSIQTGLEPSNLSKVEVNQLIQQIHSSYKAVSEKNGIVLSAYTSSIPLYIKTDKTKLSQIIANLVNNAIKYTSEGNIDIRYELQDESILFQISDTGIGIDKEHHNYIFERFGQVKAANQAARGTGLGLSICKSFAEIINGKIWVESQSGRGSTFFLSIPYTDEDKNLISTKKTIKQETRNPVQKIKNLLVAEDELYNYKLIEAILKNEKFKCFHAVNGLEAVKMCKENPSIDIVLMDIKMPEMDGETALLKIREFNPDIPIIAQTAYAMENDKIKFLKAGFSDYIAKPIRRLELLEKIHSALQLD